LPSEPKTVLIVDPEPDLLESTGQLIEALGYPVLRLAEASEVLEVVERERPALVLLEVRMPGLNLAGLMAALRLHPQTARIPVAFFSASIELASLAARHQAWGHLAKPFGYEELAHLLGRALGPAPGHAEVKASLEVEREIRTAFRESRNLLAALRNYTKIIERTELDAQARAAVARMDDLVLMLEARTERLRAYIVSLVGPFQATTPMPSEARTLSRRPSRERKAKVEP
jgi:CheY-like chemotaxis protein